jgi:hypothetical protein
MEAEAEDRDPRPEPGQLGLGAGGEAVVIGAIVSGKLWAWWVTM